MKSTDWKHIAELVGIAAIIASLLFVGLQIRQEQEIALIQTTQSWVEASNDLNIATSAYADLWVKSNNGEELSDEESLIMKQLVDGWYRTAMSNAFQRRRLDVTGRNTLLMFAIQLYENPGAARVWMEMTEDELRYRIQLSSDETAVREVGEEIREYLAKLERLNQR